MKPSETIVYIKYDNFVKGHKLYNIIPQCEFNWYLGKIIKVKREMLYETEQNINTH